MSVIARRCIWLLVMLTLVALVRPTLGQSVGADVLEEADVIPGELLVTFQPGRTDAQQAAAVQPHGGAIFGRIPALNLVAVRFERLRGGLNAQATADLMATLERAPGVALVEPNYRYQLIDALPASDPRLQARANELPQQSHLPVVWSANNASFIPNDPYISGQYAWTNIQAYRGWALDNHFSSVVAVVDTGVQLDHPDLAAQIVQGYDFVDDDTLAEDGYGHGTHVAGTIAAVTDNGVGVAGTCPACRIMPVRVLDRYGGSAFTVAAGIVFASDNGARVINLSLGGPYSSIVEESLALATRRGALPVCAAGNDGTNDTRYSFPAADDHCIAVAATTIRDELAWFSNYGSWVDIAAPGESIYSTLPYDEYFWADGTSMATPHVAGVAGLLAGSGMSSGQVRARLLQTADPIPGTGTQFMNGRLNLHRALRGN